MGNDRSIKISTSAVAKDGARGVVLFLPDDYSSDEDVIITVARDSIKYIGGGQMIVTFSAHRRYKIEWEEYNDLGDFDGHMIDYLYGDDIANIFENGCDTYAHLKPKSLEARKASLLKELIDE